MVGNVFFMLICVYSVPKLNEVEERLNMHDIHLGNLGLLGVYQSEKKCLCAFFVLAALFLTLGLFKSLID